jgi:VanZ family protein
MHPFTFLMRWLAVFIWMGIIFILSTDSFSSARTELFTPSTIGFVIRKLAHGIEYFILAILLMRAMAAGSTAVLAKRHMLWSVIFAVTYAISDEWHQSFVLSRNAKATDVIIDAIGAVCGAICFYYRFASRSARKSNLD